MPYMIEWITFGSEEDVFQFGWPSKKDLAKKQKMFVQEGLQLYIKTMAYFVVCRRLVDDQMQPSSKAFKDE